MTITSITPIYECLCKHEEHREGLYLLIDHQKETRHLFSCSMQVCLYIWGMDISNLEVFCGEFPISLWHNEKEESAASIGIIHERALFTRFKLENNIRTFDYYYWR